MDDASTQATQLDEWVFKAEGDFELAKAAKRLRKKPQPDGACFHCQQCAEKYLKAFLVMHGQSPPKIHDLRDILGLCAVYDPMLIALAQTTELLNPYSVAYRYPGESATSDEAEAAVAAMVVIRRVMRGALGLK